MTMIAAEEDTTREAMVPAPPSAEPGTARLARFQVPSSSLDTGRATTWRLVTDPPTVRSKGHGIDVCLGIPRLDQVLAPDLPPVAGSIRLPWPLSGCSSVEAFALGLLSAASVLAVGYGFLCGIGLVGNWGLFQAGIERLVH